MVLRLEPIAQGDAQPADPTHDPAAAAEVFAELRGGEPVSALNELTQWLGELNAAENHDEGKRSEILARIQESGEPHVAALLAQSIRKGNPDAKARDAAWHAIDAFLAPLASAMSASSRLMLKEAAAKPPMQSAAAAGAARLLRVCRLQLKSCLVRYLHAPSNLWRNAYVAHRAAEALHCDAIAVRTQGTNHTATTVTQELLRLLMLQAASPDRMAPGQIEVADWAVEHLGEHFVLLPRGTADGPFCFDPASDEPPRLACSPAGDATALRYFAAGAGHDHLAHIGSEWRLAKRVDIKREIAPHCQLSAVQHLLAAWNAELAEPSTTRSPASATLEVVRGFGQVWQQLSRAQSLGAMGLVDDDDEPQRAPETWTLREADDRELGVDIPQGAGGGACCGDLVAVSSRAGEWAVALIGSMRAQAQGLRADLLVLSGQPQAVHLSAVIPKGEEEGFSNESARAFGFNRVRALLLAGGDEGARAADVMLSPRHWKDGRAFQIAEQTRYLRPVRTTQSGDDYSRVTFRWSHEP